MRRRQLLRWLGTFGGAAGLAGLGRLASATHASGSAVVRVRAATFVDDRAVRVATSDAGQVFESPIIEPGVAFIALGVEWPTTVRDLQVRVRSNTGDWSDWLGVGDHETHVGPDYQTAPSGFRGLLFTPRSVAFQYRYQADPGQGSARLRIVAIDTTDGPAAPKPTAAQLAAAALPLAAQPQTVISRASWGCNESYRFDASGNLIWPCDYRIVQKGIVHHTVTDTGGNDPAAIVRAIYYYHAVTLGWGDIGYNFLVDYLGNVYEGRYGGPNVVGGHAAQYNWGSVGIAAIGDFTSATPTQAMRTFLARMLAWKCQYLDPHGDAYFIDNFYPTIAGHRDFNAGLPSYYKTSCPGDGLYELLPGLRGDVLWNLGGTVPTPAAKLSSVSYNPSSFAPSDCAPFNGTISVTAVVQNTGTGTLVTMGPSPGLTYQETDTFRSLGYSEIAGTWRVGIQLDPPGMNLGVDHAYRWGFPDALEPGKSATVIGKIVLTNPTSRVATSGVVQEGVGWTTGPGPITIQVGGSSATPTANLPRRVFIPFLKTGGC